MSKEEMLADLAPLIAEAKAKKLWLWCQYQNLWFSPEDLALANANGRFRWGAVNFEMRDPEERLLELGREVGDAIAKHKMFSERLSQWKAAQ